MNRGAPGPKIRFKKRKEFFDYQAEICDTIWPGDMVSIHGYKEGGRPHYHRIIILEKDPISGVPVRVAGNAVLPREQTIEGVMQISPKRSWRHRFRILEPWLKHVTDAMDAAKQL